MTYWQSSRWLLQWSCSMSLIISLTGSKLTTVTMTQIYGLILVCWLFYCCNMSMHMQKVINYFISFFLILKWLTTLELPSMVPRTYTTHFSYNTLPPCSVWKKKDTTKASEELGTVPSVNSTLSYNWLLPDQRTSKKLWKIRRRSLILLIGVVGNIQFIVFWHQFRVLPVSPNSWSFSLA